MLRAACQLGRNSSGCGDRRKLDLSNFVVAPLLRASKSQTTHFLCNSGIELSKKLHHLLNQLELCRVLAGTCSLSPSNR